MNDKALVSSNDMETKLPAAHALAY